MALQVLFGLCIGICIATAIALAILAWRFVLKCETTTPNLSFEWVSGLSAHRYAPMMWLADEADFRFLRVQPGYTKKLENRLREHRYRMFLAYLDSLRSDFEGLATALKCILANAEQDRADQASALLRTQAAFRCGFWMAKARAYAWRNGVCQMDVGHLLAIFDAALGELRTLSPAPGTARVV